MTIPNPAALAEHLLSGHSACPMTPEQAALGTAAEPPPRNNRRPYKADIRRVAEEQLALAAAEQQRLTARIGFMERHAEHVAETHRCIVREISGERGLWRLSARRWRIAALVAGGLAVVGWAL